MFVVWLLFHLLQVLLEHLYHSLQFSHLPLQPYVTLAVKRKEQSISKPLLLHLVSEYC